MNNGYTIVDRSTQELIRAEEMYQLGGDVSEDTLIEIGKKTGANVLLVVFIQGTTDETRLLVARVIDLITGKVLGSENESLRI